MDPRSNEWTLMLLFCVFLAGVGCNSVEKKIYVRLNHTANPCVRLLNATHQIGCQSSLSGNVGVLHVPESEADLDWVLSTGPNPPYMVILESHLFTRSAMMKLKSDPGRVAGVAVVMPDSNPAEGFSPHTTCPNQNSGVYTESYDSALANCNVTMWNPLGNGLSYEEFDFPIFSLKDDNDTAVIRQCYLDHNRALNGSTPQYPLCAMQLSSHMSAVTDTATCMRRNEISLSLSSEFVCDPLGDNNVWASSRPINSTAKGHKDGESVVIAAARLDGRSFFFNLAPGAQSGVSGFVSLVAAAHALRDVTHNAPPNRTILYTFFQGETFDYIGSSRMVYDMKHNKFALDLDNIHSVLEVGQVGLGVDNKLWLHSDPVSRRNGSVNAEVRRLIDGLQTAVRGLNISAEEPDVSQPLPPSSFQRFLRDRPFPGVVIQDHRAAFTSRFYQSIYDNAAYLNVSYPPGMTPDEQFEFVTDKAKALALVATAVARALYLQAGGEEARLPDINADEQIVSKMLYGFLVRSKNAWFQQIIPSDFANFLKEQPTNLYIGAVQQNSELTMLVQHLMANLTGSVVNVTKENCQSQREDEDDTHNKHMYTYIWVQGAAPPNATERQGFCVRSTARISRAVSPALDLLKDYSSTEFSTWTESRWKKIEGRIFLVASQELEMLTLGVGVAVLLTSLVLTYVVSSKADILFSSGREPTSATY